MIVSLVEEKDFHALWNDVKYLIAKMENFTPINNKRLLTSKEVCKKLGITARTLQLMRDESRIAFINQPGKRTVRYRESDIIKYMDANTFPARKGKYS